ncbi:MAG: AMP-binding protein [Betaproteobacteria bacterium]|nr:AMP-binding protein [Betaproteobacteria bacterium]MCC6250456.1 AMP-binding protein [Rubrivivax sp.]
MDRLILDHVLDHEANRANQVFFTQPLGGGPVQDYTWGQVVGEARRVAAHLQSLGLPRGARVAILSKNCAHFIMAELAIWLGGYTTVAIFPTETAETIKYVLEHSEASALFVGKLDTWPAQQPGVPKGLPCIAFPLAPAEARRDFDGWDAIVARTAPLAGRITRQADELAMLIYTSGSTGTPKGVMNTFAAFSWAAAAAGEFASERVGAGTDRRVISYLPLAHSFERTWIEGAALIEGTTHMFFADTLQSFIEDVKRARPTLFISVPRLWLKFQQGVFAKMPPAKLERLLKIPILGRIVAKKVLAGLGLDSVVYAGSGSAPLPPDLIRWYQRLGLKLGEGYGMTEDNSVSHTSRLDIDGQAEPGWVGVPMPGVEVKLAPDGEVLIRSPGQFTGYYKQPELTAASFTEDGFFRTGDLGERRPNGLLRITGRAKELFKTAKGKYVAPAPIENLLLAHAQIESCMVSGVGQVAAYALVVPAEDLRPRLADSALRNEFEVEMAALLERVNAELTDYEQLGLMVISRDPWTIEAGTLTPTMKIKRTRIETIVAPQVEGWYARGQRVIWA